MIKIANNLIILLNTKYAVENKPPVLKPKAGEINIADVTADDLTHGKIEHVDGRLKYVDYGKPHYPVPAPVPVRATWKEVPPYSVTARKLIETAYQGNKAVTQQSIDAARLNQKNHPEYKDFYTPLYSDELLDRPRTVGSVYGIRDTKGKTVPFPSGGNAAFQAVEANEGRPPPPWGVNDFVQLGDMATAPIFGRPNMEGGQPILDQGTNKTYLKPNREFTLEEQNRNRSNSFNQFGLSHLIPAEVGHHEGTHSLMDFSNVDFSKMKEPPPGTVRRAPWIEPEQGDWSTKLLNKFLGKSTPTKPEPSHLGESAEFPAGVAETKSHLYRTKGLNPVYDTPAKVETYMQNLKQLQQQSPDRYTEMYNYLQSLSPEDRMIHLGMIAQNTAAKRPGQQPSQIQA